MAATNVQRFSGDVLLSGEMNLQHVSNTASIKLNSNVVTEFPRSKKFIKYPRVALTSASQDGYVVTTSNVSVNGDGYAAYRVFDNILPDGTTTVGWRTDAGYDAATGLASGITTRFTGDSGEWVEIQLPNSLNLSSINLKPGNEVDLASSSTRFPKVFVIYGYNGNAWIRVEEFTTSPIQSFTDVQTFHISNPVGEFSKFVLVVKQTYSVTGAPSGVVNIGEIEYFGIPEYDPEAHGTDVTVKSYPNVPNTDWLEVYYDAKDLENGSITNVDDLTPNGTNDGTATNVTVSDGAFVFNGTSSLLEKTSLSIPGGDNPFTFSFWIKNDDFDSTQYILRLGDNQTMYQNVNIYKTSSNQIVFTTWLLDFPINYTFTSNRWNHISLMYPGGGWEQSNLIVYVDGKRFNFGANRSSGGTGGNVMTLATSLTLRLGGFSSGNMHFDGSIANFRLFNRALTQDEVWQLYAYQKEYFGHGALSMTLKAGRLGIGTSEPKATLDIRGEVLINGYQLTSMYPGFATGGDDVYDIDGYRIHVFTTSGTFVVPGKDITTDILLVGGGGGGGQDNAGGGGAGGLIFKPSHTFVGRSTDTGRDGAYTIVIGSGGAGSTNQDSVPPNPGGDTYIRPLVWRTQNNSYTTGTFTNIFTAKGGGPGNTGGAAAATTINGGSGGGQDAEVRTGTGGGVATQPTRSGDSGTYGYGNNGGNGINNGGGGGGGAGKAGEDGSGSILGLNYGGYGGDGLSGASGYDFAEIFGTKYGEVVGEDVYFAGGGAGANRNVYVSFSAPNGYALGGKGGGGSAGGTPETNEDGLPGTGGGGAGATWVTTPTNYSYNIHGGNGGSGIVMIRYRL
jgi:hypothetical protein